MFPALRSVRLPSESSGLSGLDQRAMAKNDALYFGKGKPSSVCILRLRVRENPTSRPSVIVVP